MWKQAVLLNTKPSGSIDTRPETKPKPKTIFDVGYKYTWYDIKFNQCFRSPYNNLLQIMEMAAVYELRPDDYDNETQFLSVVKARQLTEDQLFENFKNNIQLIESLYNDGSTLSLWIMYIKHTKPEVFKHMTEKCRFYRLDITKLESFESYARQLKERDIIMQYD